MHRPNAIMKQFPLASFIGQAWSYRQMIYAMAVRILRAALRT
jgi:hypothetical protein